MHTLPALYHVALRQKYLVDAPHQIVFLFLWLVLLSIRTSNVEIEIRTKIESRSKSQVWLLELLIFIKV